MESVLVKLDATVNAMKYSPLQEMKGIRGSDYDNTLREGRKEGTQHGRTKVKIELMSEEKPSFSHFRGFKYLLSFP